MPVPVDLPDDLPEDPDDDEDRPEDLPDDLPEDPDDDEDPPEDVLDLVELLDDLAADVDSVRNTDLRLDSASFVLLVFFADDEDRLSENIDELLKMLGSDDRLTFCVLTDCFVFSCATNGLLFGNALAANGLPP